MVVVAVVTEKVAMDVVLLAKLLVIMLILSLFLMPALVLVV